MRTAPQALHQRWTVQCPFSLARVSSMPLGFGEMHCSWTHVSVYVKASWATSAHAWSLPAALTIMRLQYQQAVHHMQAHGFLICWLPLGRDTVVCSSALTAD